jgi:glycosyltransferase involved in cell wall biosynthesis
LRALHLTPFWGANSGGQGTVANELVSAQKDLAIDAQVWTVEQNAESPYDGWVLPNCKDFRDFPTLGPSRLGLSPKMIAEVKDASQRWDVVHLHGLWTFLSYTTLLFNKRGVPTIVAPHIALMKEALARSQPRKQMALKLYEQRNLNSATCFHACSTYEIDSIRDFGLKAPVALIPNGVSDDWLAMKGDAERIRQKLKLKLDRRYMLFLSRIHPVKGLPMLLEAMAIMRRSLADWDLIIAGMQELDHETELKTLTSKLGLDDQVHFVGPLFGQDKRDALELAEVFVLPTTVENFAIVVAEALGAGVPVLTTKGAPWQQIPEHGCGWWVEPSVDGLAQGLEQMAATDPSTLQKMGCKGRQLVENEYTWPKVARLTLRLYNWLVDGGEAPEFVHFHG